MKYILGFVKNGLIEANEELSDSEYDEYRESSSYLKFFSTKQQLIQIMRLNYESYKRFLKQSLEEYSKNPSIEYARFDYISLNINRHLLNYLSSIRTFLDHTETILKKNYGNNSLEVKDFKNVCSKSYDEHFAYRFLYRLRDYAQHCGMPLGKIEIDSKEDPPYSGKITTYLAVKFSRDTLLTNFDSWKRIRKEIEMQPPEFEINQHIDKVMECLEEINLTLIKADMPKALESAKKIQGLLNCLNYGSGLPCIFLEIVPKKEEEVEHLRMKIEWIPLHLVKMVIAQSEKF